MSGIILPQKKFYECLKQDSFEDTAFQIDFDVLIDQSIVDWHHRHLKNLTFKEKVIIRDVEINSGLGFSNCNFEKGIVFHNVKSTNYNSTYNPNSNSLSFSECIAKFIIFKNDCHLSRSVEISNNSQIERIEINELKVENSGFEITKSTISYLLISNSKTDITLSDSTFNDAIRIETLIGNISFIKNEFEADLMLWNVQCNFGLTLNDNLFKDKFNIDGSRIKSFSIIGDTFEKKSELENRDLSGNNLETYLNELYISEAKFIEGFDFNGLGQKLNKLDLILTPEFKGVLNFDNWSIDNTIISGINQNLKLLLKRISFRFLMINDFTNYSDISFDKCKGIGDSTLNLSDCDLGSTKFNDFGFDTFLKIRIDNISIDKINPTNSNWFSDDVLEIGDGTQSKLNELKSKRELYRQIKQALKNNGNQIDSLVFQARELSTYKNELEISKEKTFGDKIIMWVSETNDFGLNWLKPVCIVSIVTLIIYILILPSISINIDYTIAKDLTDLENSWKAFTSNGKTLWQLFNPIRKFEDAYGKNANGFIYFLDLLHRIFLGIMIFQIIKAFRKYVNN